MTLPPFRSALGLLTLLVLGCAKERAADTGDTGAGSPADLVGSAWRLTNLAGTPALSGAEATLEFPEAGKVVGRGSCNRFFGSAELAAGTITLGAIGATRMACADSINRQEAEYLRLLGAAERFEVDGTTLRIFAKGTAEPLLFTRALAPFSFRDPTGVWTITGHRSPGISAMSSAEADDWKGRTLQFGIAEAIAGADTCVAPSYHREIVPADSLLTTDFRISATALGLPASRQLLLGVTRVSCDGKPWPALGGLLFQTADDRALAVQDGVFFELQRQDH